MITWKFKKYKDIMDTRNIDIRTERKQSCLLMKLLKEYLFACGGTGQREVSQTESGEI